MRWIVLTAALALFAGPGLEAQRGGGSADAWTLLSAKYDKNRDGKITPAEYPRAAGKFDAYDRNGDGAITRQDFTGGARRRPAGPRGGGDQSRIAAYLAAAADTDCDLTVTAKERKAFADTLMAADGKQLDAAKLKQVVTGGLSGPRGRMRSRMVVRALDDDRNGIIVAADLERMFALLDRNRDGVIAATEIPGRRRSVRPPEAQLPRPGDPAHDFDLPYTGKRQGSVKLSSFAGKKPVALIFGSYT